MYRFRGLPAGAGLRYGDRAGASQHPAPVWGSALLAMASPFLRCWEGGAAGETQTERPARPGNPSPVRRSTAAMRHGLECVRWTRPFDRK